MNDKLKTCDFYQENKKPGEEGYWMGYLAASNDLHWDFSRIARSSSLRMIKQNMTRLLIQREKFMFNCEDVIRSEYEQSIAKFKVVQTETIEYNFE